MVRILQLGQHRLKERLESQELKLSKRSKRLGRSVLTLCVIKGDIRHAYSHQARKKKKTDGRTSLRKPSVNQRDLYSNFKLEIQGY